MICIQYIYVGATLRKDEVKVAASSPGYYFVTIVYIESIPLYGNLNFIELVCSNALFNDILVFVRGGAHIKLKLRKLRNYSNFDYIDINDCIYEKKGIGSKKNILTLLKCYLNQYHTEKSKIDNKIISSIVNFLCLHTIFLTFCTKRIRGYLSIYSESYIKNILKFCSYYKQGYLLKTDKWLIHRILINEVCRSFFTKNLSKKGKLVLNGKSLLEIGPGLGAFYTSAKLDGVKNFYIFDKNPIFSHLSEKITSQKQYNFDISSDAFIAKLRAMPKVDVFFAKGIFNIYGFLDLNIYCQVLEEITRKISVGLFITYNVNRVDSKNLDNIYYDCFVANGWRPVNACKEMEYLMGINYLPEVRSDIWLIDKQKTRNLLLRKLFLKKQNEIMSD